MPAFRWRCVPPASRRPNPTADFGPWPTNCESQHRRLDHLKFRNRDVRREFDAEYQRLTELQKRAFRLLALVRSNTFLPWVLQPLLDVPRDEAETLVVRLDKAQLLDVATDPIPSGLPRYQFHPLVLLFAREQLANSEPEAVQDEARRRLHAAYLEGIEQVILDDGARGRESRPTTRLGTRPRYIQGVAWLEHVHNAPDEWVRAEYPNLVESVLAAADDPANHHRDRGVPEVVLRCR